MSNRVEDVKKRLEAATPGPWHKEGPHAPAPGIRDTPCYGIENQEQAILYASGWLRRFDADFIAHAPEDIRYLLAEIAKRDRAIEVMKDGFKHYAGRSLAVKQGYCRLNYTKAEDSPGLPFHEGETWLLGDHADEALAKMSEILEEKNGQG